MTARQENYERSNLTAAVQQISHWLNSWLSDQNWALRRMTVGAMLSMALIAFELFNFDTTPQFQRYVYANSRKKLPATKKEV